MWLRRVLNLLAIAPVAVTALAAAVVQDGTATSPISPFPRDGMRGDAAPAWSRDDTQIAFMTVPPGPLLVMASTGGEPQRLFADDGHYATPAWSRDGKRLAFASDRGGAWTIWSSAALAHLYRTVQLTRPRFEALFGPLAESESSYREASPITHVAGISVPLLVLHGAGDQVIPFDQSVRFVDALHSAGKNVRLEKFEGGHGFQDAEEALAFETVASFLREQLK